MAEILNGPSVGQKYGFIVGKMAKEIITTLDVDPLHESQCDQLTKFRTELRYGTLKNLNEWYSVYTTKD